MKYHLDIYFNNQLVNTAESDDELTVLREFTKCMTADKVRLVKTKFKKLPYQDRIKIEHTWPTTMPGHRYSYVFDGLCGVN